MIFVVLLTIAYIIYYGYNISKDLYGKKTEDKGDEVETFEVDEMETVVATPVRESEDGGFSLGGVPANPVTDAAPEATPEEEASGNMESIRKIGDMKDKFEDADSYSEGGITYTELDDMIATRDPKLKFIPSIKQHRDIL